MGSFNRRLAVAGFIALGVLVVGFSMAARAGTRMYAGTLTMQAMGNDTATGAPIELQTDDFIGIPFGRHCDVGPYHAKEIITFPTALGSNTVMWTLPRYGGQQAVHDSNVDGIPDLAEGCLPASQRAGVPLLGSGTLATTETGLAVLRTPLNPRGFSIPQGALARTTSGSFSSYGPYGHTATYADLRNAHGSFEKNGGIGNFTWSEVTGMAPHLVNRGRVVVTEGSNRFGGTMQMLGSFYTNELHYYKAHLSVATYTWLFQYHGAGGLHSSGGNLSAPGVTTATNIRYTTLYGSVLPSNVFGLMFSWTTGTVSVTAVHGPFPTVLARHGFDNRGPYGYGEIQLVTPMLTRWVWSFGNRETASIGVMRLNLPEPQDWMMLGAGLSLLALLYRSNRGRAIRP